MITAARTDAEKARCREILGSVPFFAAVIAAQVEISPSATMYLADEDAVLLAGGDSAILYGTVHDAPQLESFLTFLGVHQLKSNGFIPQGMQATPLCLAECTTSLAVEPPQGFTLEKQPSFRLLCALSFLRDGISGEDYAAEVCARRNHGLGACYVLLQNGTPVSCAAVLANTPWESYLGDVATLPTARGHGAASYLVRQLCADFATPAHPARLLCHETLLPFYTQHGFTQTGTIFLCTKETN